MTGLFGAGESTSEWIERRRRDVARVGELAEAGWDAWVDSTRDGANLSAPRPSDVIALGARARTRAPVQNVSSRPSSVGAVPPYRPSQGPASAPRSRSQAAATDHGSPDGLHAGLFPGATSVRPDDLADLRRQQAEFRDVTREISRENSWMAIPALAPAAAVMVLEAPAVVGTLARRPTPKAPPLNLTTKDPYLRVGDNYATRAGRRAHAALRERVAQKPGWDPEPTVKLDDGRILRPDVRTPARVRKPGEVPEPYQMELKPNTPSGRRAAARAVKKYEGTNVKTRPIFYDPKPFI
jgi:hypothetical protein